MGNTETGETAPSCRWTHGRPFQTMGKHTNTEKTGGGGGGQSNEYKIDILNVTLHSHYTHKGWQEKLGTHCQAEARLLPVLPGHPGTLGPPILKYALQKINNF